MVKQLIRPVVLMQRPLAQRRTSEGQETRPLPTTASFLARFANSFASQGGSDPVASPPLVLRCSSGSLR
jgi:hypothetical protein